MAKDILKATLDEWDRIVVRPYREIEQLQVNISCLIFIVKPKSKVPKSRPNDTKMTWATTPPITFKHEEVDVG